MVLHERSQSTGWTVIADLPLNNLIGGLITQRNYSLAAASMLLIIALALVGGFPCPDKAPCAEADGPGRAGILCFLPT